MIELTRVEGTRTSASGAATRNAYLSNWVSEAARLTKPASVVWCDGSEQERQRLTEQAVAAGTLIPLNPEKLPGCYLHRSHPNDVARVEHLTFICSRTQEGAGPTILTRRRDDGSAVRRSRPGQVSYGCR